MTTESVVVHVVFAIALIIALSQVFGLLARRLGQPAVIGQLFAGIALGPSVLGQFPGGLTDRLFPREVLPFLTVVAQVALVLFLFSVGYELDRRVLRRRVRAVPLVAGAGFVVPMLLGAGSTVVLAGWYAATGRQPVPASAFVLFVAVAVSITAVPVLAGIIRERGLNGTTAGVVAMTSAGIIDALGWLALAAAVLQASGGGGRPGRGGARPPGRPRGGVGGGGGGFGGGWVTAVLLVAYLLVMLAVARPALRRWIDRSTGSLSHKLLVATAFAMGSAWVTGALGLHVILGAFLAGLVMPTGDDGTPHPELLRPVEQTGAVLLPVFFVVSGLSTDIGALRWADVGLLVAVCAIATAGKLGAGLLAARVAGLSWRESTVVGVLLNTRGLTELIALNVGLQAGIIGERLYTVFVLMALLTTAATGPLLAILPLQRTTAAPTGTRPIRVLRLTPHFYWPQLAHSSWPVKFDAIGGMQSQIHRLTEALDGTGIEQTVLTLRIPGAPDPWRMSDHTEVRGVRVPVLPLRSRIRGMVDLNLSWALGVLAYLVRHPRRPDLLHVHCSGVIIPPLLGWFLCRLLRVPLVLTVHCSIIATYHPMNTLDQLLQPLARWIERRAVRAATRTITLTPRTVPLFTSSTGRPAEEFVVLPDVIDADAFAARATPAAVEAARRRWVPASGPAVVGYVGRIAREKGWPIILDIAEELRDEPVHWLICGDGNERDLFERDVEQRGLTDRVTVTGYLPNEDVPALMRTMDLLLMAPLHEEFGSVMLEAMAVGLPIVAVGVGGVAEVLDHGELGWLVPERTAAAFAAGIRAALADAEWRRVTAERAAETVRKRYNLAYVADLTAEVYRSVTRSDQTDREPSTT